MTAFIVTYLPWVLSCFTIWMTTLAGNKHKSTWAIGLFAQILWVVWISLSGSWGLMPATVVLVFIYIRNHFKWKNDESA